MLSYQKEVSKYVPLNRLLQIKKDNYVAESGQDYCPFSIESAILERKENLAAAQVNAVTRWEKTLANYMQNGIGGMVPPAPIVEDTVFKFTIQF